MNITIKHKKTGDKWFVEDLAYDDLLGSGADLSDFEISGVPVIPNINSAILEAVRTPGNQLYMSDWHGTREQPDCKTAHCIAGWAVHLAGPEGYALEAAMPGDYDEATAEAAALIFAASGCPIIPDFFTSNERAMEELIERANCEKGVTS